MDIDYFANENQSFWEEISNNCLMMTLNPLVRRPRQIENPADYCSTRKPRNMELRFTPPVSQISSQPSMNKHLAKSCGCFVIRIGLLGLLKVKAERERILESRAVLLSMVIMAPRDVRIASLRRVKRQLLQKHTLQTIPVRPRCCLLGLRKEMQ